MKKISTTIFGVALVLVVYAMQVTYVAHAQSISSQQISPTRYEATVQRGQTLTYPIKLSNLSDTPLSGRLSVVNFTVEDNSSTPLLHYSQDIQASKYELASWVTLSNTNVTIAPSDSTLVKAAVGVPENAPGGGHYAAILFTSTTPKQESSETTSSSTFSSAIGSLLVLTVEGDVSYTVQMKDFQTPAFLEYGPIPLEFSLAHRGNTHTNVTTQVWVEDMFGSRIARESSEQSNIFPETEQGYSFNLGKKWMFGKYAIKGYATYGSSLSTKIQTKHVWIVPYKLLLSLACTSILILFVVQRIRRRLFKRE